MGLPDFIPETPSLEPFTDGGGVLQPGIGAVPVFQSPDKPPQELLDFLSSVKGIPDACLVLATGVFDVFHSEHDLFLRKAKAMGTHLIVGVESDVRVRQIKGEGRPINDQAARCRQVAAHPSVDFCFVLPEQFSKPEDHKQFIAAIQPRYLAVSSHTAHLDKKQVVLAQFGGDVVVVHEHNPAVSSSLIIGKK